MTVSSESAEPPSTVEPHRAWWRLVGDAVRGVRHDYTEGSIARALLLLAVPMVLETLMESLFAVVDVFFVARLGADAVATVGLTESMLTIVYALAIGLSIGATATIARRSGEKDADGAARAAAQCVAIGLAVAAVIGVCGVTFARDLLRVMGASDAVLAVGSRYTQVMLGGNATIVLLFLVNAIFRGAGDAAIAMRVLWLANAINILLGPCLIFGLGPFPELGVTGAAVATTIGRGTGVLVQFFHLARGSHHLTIHRRHLDLDFAAMRRIVRLSGSGILQILIATTSWVAVVRVLAMFGSTALAGNTIGIRIVMFALLPSWGLANAAATMVGQALGARKPDRAARAAWMAGFYNMLFLGSIGAVFAFIPESIVAIFTDDVEVARHAAACLRTVSYGFVLYAYGMVLTSSLNGAGDTWTPTVINIVCYWCFEIPLAYALARGGMGPSGVFWAVTASFSLLAVVSAVVFAGGRWKLRAV